MEWKINEKFEYDNFEYQCLEGSDVRGERCKDCCLRDENGWICRIHTDKDIMACFGPCNANYRTDGKYVFFKKIGLAVRKNMKPFDLQAAKAGHRVCTRDGRPARVICFDRNSDRPIIALVMNKSREGIHSYYEEIYSYYNNGQRVQTSECADDLMKAPEYKHGWVNIFMDQESYFAGDTIHYLNSQLFPTEEMALEYARGSSKKLVATKEVRWEE